MVEMKICWDNLENLVFTKNGKWRKIYSTGNGSTTYHYRESCLNCGAPFLGTPTSTVCSHECRIAYHKKCREEKKNYYSVYDPEPSYFEREELWETDLMVERSVDGY